MLVGLDAYSLHPRALSPLAFLRWAVAHGAEGVQFSGFSPADEAALDAGTLREIAAFVRDHGLYLEWGGARHIPRTMAPWDPIDIGPFNRRAVEQAVAVGARVIRSCSGGLMRWAADAPSTETFVRETAEALHPLGGLFQDHGVVLAIETHFEFTSFELLRILERCEAEPGGWIGICLDTMNLLTMLEDPVSATRRLLPWVVATHIKDGGVRLDERGLTTFPTPLGEGVVDFPAILALLDTLPSPVTLTVESHGGSFDLPIYDEAFLAGFPDLTAAELAALTRLAVRSDGRPVCRPTSRERWPEVCETRVASDLHALRRIAAAARHARHGH